MTTTPNSPATGAPPLRIRGLRAGYGTRVILDGVDLYVPAGEIHVVLGGSGCGKSTLLRAATGLERPWAGSVELFGEPLDCGRKGARPTNRF